MLHLGQHGLFKKSLNYELKESRLLIVYSNQLKPTLNTPNPYFSLNGPEKPSKDVSLQP